MIILKEKAGGALQGGSIARRTLFEAEMERAKMIWERRNSDWAAQYGST